jgi:hypothetical protein
LNAVLGIQSSHFRNIAGSIGCGIFASGGAGDRQGSCLRHRHLFDVHSRRLEPDLKLAVGARTAFINTLTSQRIKWIDELRQDISSFSGFTHTWCFTALEGKPQEYDVLKEIDRLRHVIRLRLNRPGHMIRRLNP